MHNMLNGEQHFVHCKNDSIVFKVMFSKQKTEMEMDSPLLA